MQERPWQKGLAHAGGTFLLLAIPAVALMCFSPTALSAFSAATPQVASVAMAPTTADATNDAAVLDNWSDTKLTVVQQARAQSKTLNDALKAIRKELNGLSTKDPLYTFKHDLLQQSYLAIAAQRDAWDNTWKKIGVPGSNIVSLQNQLINLQIAFVKINGDLATLQAQEVASGSITKTSPPTF
jgi:hypothetical protein